MNTSPIFIAKTAQLNHPEISLEAKLVRNSLIEHGLETPMIETGLSAEDKCQRIRS